MLRTLNNTQKGIAYALFGFSAFVISDSCAKWLTPHYPVLQIVGWTYLFALLFGLIFSRQMGGLRETLKTTKLSVHLARSAFNCGLALSVVLAFNHLPLTSVYPVLFLSPFIITLLAIPIYKETVSKISWLIILLGFCGVIVAYRPWTGEVNPWIFAAFFTTFCIAGLSLLARAVGQDQTILSLSFYPTAVNSALLFPFALFMFPFPALAHLPVFLLAGVMLTAGITCVATACLKAPYSIISPLHYSQIVLVFLIGYFVFGEIPDIWMTCGSLMIVASGLMLLFVRDRKNK